LQHHGPSEWAHAVAALRLDERQVAASFRGRGPEAVRLYHYVVQEAIHEPVLDGLVSAIKYDRTYFDKIVASVGPLMEKLTTGQVAELISPDYFDLDEPRPLFDWLAVIRKRGIVYIGLDALSDPTVAAAVGNSMFADLTSVAGRLYKHGPAQGLPEIPDPAEIPRIAVHADEFNEIIGDEFVPLLNKAGGAGFQVTCYTQTWSDVEARLQSRAKAGQVAGNLNTLIVLRVLDQDTAEMLTLKLPEIEVHALRTRSGATDSSVPAIPVDFVSTTLVEVATQRVPLLTPADLISLPKGQAFALLEGGQLWKIRLPLLEARDDPALPRSLAAALSEMAKRYTTASGREKA
ncbi:MAG: conjugative transfer system coupling protein TraD, partial [Gammaproteobacteria bacterium]